MTSKERMIAALERRVPDRLPATTHHLMPSYLERFLGGASDAEFFTRFGLDPVIWVNAVTADASRDESPDPSHVPGALEARRITSDSWRIDAEPVTGGRFASERFTITTPGGVLTTVLQSDAHTTWVAERLIKRKTDIDLIAAHAPQPVCDVAAVNAVAEDVGERGLVRGFGLGFEIYGQPGCWQDAAVLFGIESLILETYDDPSWVRALLEILRDRKRAFMASTRGARFDILELGGGDASTTVISPSIFSEFVAPYDAPIIEAAHGAGQRIVYHTCGGMMDILEQIADMGPDAMETFTPAGMGGDADLKEARERIGDRVCMIGGFDQVHFFQGCTPEDTRREVRRCFEAAGGNGGYVIAPSDHFFEADSALLDAFADEARRCVYA